MGVLHDVRERLVVAMKKLRTRGRPGARQASTSNAADEQAQRNPAPSTGATPGPDATRESTAVSAEPVFHTVGPGDTLTSLADHFYGDASRYLEILEANSSVLSDASEVRPGQTLRIPADPG